MDAKSSFGNRSSAYRFRFFPHREGRKELGNSFTVAAFLHVLLGLACVWRCSCSSVPFRYVFQIYVVKMTREVEVQSGLDDVSSACWARSSFTRKRLASIHFTTCFIIMLWIETYKTTAFRMDAKSGFGNRSPAYRFRSFFRTEKGEKNWLKNAKTNSVAASLK